MGELPVAGMGFCRGRGRDSGVVDRDGLMGKVVCLSGLIDEWFSSLNQSINHRTVP
jgi:hypothetical protein